MKWIWALAALLASSTELAEAKKKEWAVLVCGSRGWYNYRHHADVCHAYHTLKARGIPDERIITMMYDDVAGDQRNPFPGQLFNRPNANADPVDVYAGCKKDYTGDDVTPEMFLNVLRGDAQATRGRAVLNSTAEDDVFINFVDHGAPGLVAFPFGRLHAPDLLEALDFMYENNMYENLVFYMEACESGSMMQNLPSGKNIYAVTAANARESSWATYCPPMDDIVDGKHLHTCLGDDFSVKWLEDTDSEQGSESLLEQFKRVKNLTRRSHVLDFGDISTIGIDDIGDFFGEMPAKPSPMQKAVEMDQFDISPHAMVDSRDVGLISRFYRYTHSGSLEALEELHEELTHRKQVDLLFQQIAGKLLDDQDEIEQALSTTPPHNPKEWDCHRTVHAAYETTCDEWSDYSLKYSSTLLSICEILAPKLHGEHASAIAEAFITMCQPSAEEV
mmetsp:Transcript_8827/g.16194  ORF Transcript_8827/g.16194 Transcript_8827/m.16194 type:complete len:447 (-) Transcript_8827:150-1490(-)